MLQPIKFSVSFSPLSAMQFTTKLLYVLVVILVIGWLLGMFAFHVTSGFIHALLAIAVIQIIVKLVSGKRGI